jgi:hypothetical protein
MIQVEAEAVMMVAIVVVFALAVIQDYLHRATFLRAIVAMF